MVANMVLQRSLASLSTAGNQPSLCKEASKSTVAAPLWQKTAQPISSKPAFQVTLRKKHQMRRISAVANEIPGNGAAETEAGQQQLVARPSPGGKLAERRVKTGKGAGMADVLRVFGHLLERPFGGGECVSKAGAVVIQRVATEAQALRGQDGVSDQTVVEILKFARLMEMDMELVAAARKDETLLQRLDAAKTHCRQAFLLAQSI